MRFPLTRLPSLTAVLLLTVTMPCLPVRLLQAAAVAQTNPDRKAEADRLLQQGIEQFQTSQFEAALQSWQQALQIYREIKDRQREGWTLGNLGEAHRNLGNYVKAIKYQEQYLVIAREAKDLQSEGKALGGLGNAYASLGNYAKAVEYYQQALVVAREIKDRQSEGAALGNLGSAYNSLGNYAKAIEYSQQGLAILREIKDRPGERAVLGNLGSAYASLGNYAKAIEHQEQCLVIAREIKDRQSEGAALVNLGVAYRNLSNYAKAIEYQEQYLAIAREIKDRQSEGAALVNLGNAYNSLGKYAQAIEYYQQGLAILREIKNRPGEGSAFGNLGVAYAFLGNYAKAIEYYQQALVIAREIKDRPGEGAVLVNLGLAYRNQGNYAKAIEYSQQGLAIAREIKDRQREGAALGNLGIAYLSLGNYAKAIDYEQQSLVIAREIKDRQSEGTVLGNLGVAYFSLGNYAKAIEYAQQWLAISRTIKDQEGEGFSLDNLGATLAQQKQPELAIVFYKQSINVRESIRQDIRKLPREEQQSYQQSVAKTYRDLASLLLQHERVMEALQVLDLLKVQELQDFFKDVKGNERTAKGIEMLPEEQQILSHLDTTNLERYLKSAPITALVNQLRQTAQGQNLKLAAYTDLQARLQNLGKDSALLYPLILKDRIELVLFTHNAPPIHRSTPISQTKLEQTIQSFRAAIQQKDSQDIRQPANQLYNWLIQPIEADLKQANTKTLIYAPDGQMRYVPLAALYDGQHWLVEKYEINYVTAFSLTKLDQRSSQQPRILAGAFTDNDATVSIDGQHFVFSAIPFALPEVKDLNKQFPNATKLLIGKDFNRTAMTSDRINGYSIVHLATHGKLVSGAPEDSFILLNNNEYITLREIKDWKLPNVALVVLSACQTALGDKLGNGIEVIGFGYQLQQTQARASIATLWEISDASTGNLMNEFYARLQSQHLSPVEALREAQIALITGKGQTSGSKPRSSVVWSSGPNQAATLSRDLSHPYYWAPFILIGNGL